MADSPKSYCEFVSNLPEHNHHRIYHDFQYGFPIESDDELFGRLVLEINQAGLSWDTILKKQQNFREAYDHFSIKKVAAYNEADRTRLLNDAGIIRNALKINAAIYNAQQILGLQQSYGSFKQWLEMHRGLKHTEWVKLFKKHFKFTGGEITKEFLMSSAYISGAHEEHCVIQQKINAHKH